MTPEERALRDAWMREMWAPVHEVSREERAVERELSKLRARPVDNAGEMRREVAS